ncbi:methylmalonyl-CoA epimerase [Lederbergia lenta]|uniref:methylmalonyl-CoA epimerase n=1 Tax=Lederbergia lenta TaxID=1467 RepID=UPI00203B6C8B|nr:methylmalonyl-CoA epimerase [Lederbergia lenta]
MQSVNHIGIAVKSLEATLPFYIDVLGLKCIAIEVVQAEQVKIAFLDAGNVKIELLEPTNSRSAISKFIAKRGEGIHHVAFNVQSIDSRINEMKEQGIHMLNDFPKKGAGGAMVAFMHPKSSHGVLYEFCEKKPLGEMDSD